MSLRVRSLVVMLVIAFAVPVGSGASTTRDVVLLANAEGGTVDIIDAETFVVLRTIDVVPDGARPDPTEDPFHALSAPIVVEAAGENLAQDLDVAPDGRTLYVSRGHRGDVAAFDIATGSIMWKTPISGFRSDHMTISPDGGHLYVSALTQDVVEVLDTSTGAKVGSFPTGEWPHDNHFSHDGERIYNASIGNVLTPRETRNERPVLWPYRVTVVDADTLEVERSFEMPDGVRPFVLTHDDATMYAQLSELHGLVEVDVASGEIVRSAPLPVDEGVTEDDYDFEAPHHGLAMSPDENLLCVAGRASDYAALVSTETLEAVAVLDTDDAPSWAANTPDGGHCLLANNRADTVSVVSYETRELVATVAVGDGPKYLVGARIPADAL